MAMGLTVRQFLRCHTSAEIAELMAFDRLEPFGAGRTNMTIGTLAALLANVNRDQKKQREPFRAPQFVAFHSEPKAAVQKAPAKRRTGKTLRDHLKRRQGTGKT